MVYYLCVILGEAVPPCFKIGPLLKKAEQQQQQAEPFNGILKSLDISGYRGSFLAAMVPELALQ